MKKSGIIFLFLLIPFTSFATHIIGGGFQMTHTNEYNYRFEFQMYVDVAHAPDGIIDHETAVTAGIYNNEDNTHIANITLSRTSILNLPYTNSCHQEEVQTGVILFETTAFLDPAVYNNTQGYYVAFQTCCMPPGFLNIYNSVYEGIALYYEFPPVQKEGLPFVNSSPQLVSLHDTFATLGNEFEFNFSSTDPDADSLSYHLITPFAGHAYAGGLIDLQPKPYASVQWEAGFSLSIIIPGTIPLEINEETGMLRLNADAAGMYLFAVETEEYRDGVKIGSAIRQFRIFVFETGTTECVTGTKKSIIEKSSIIGIVPNPSKDLMRVEVNKSLTGFVKIEVINSLGIVKEKFDQEINVNTNSFEYNSSDLNPGIYILYIISDSQILTGTFIKE